MTISSTTRKAGPFGGTGAQTAYPFAFKVFAASDMLVVQTDAAGIETTLTLTTHYTVALNADQNVSPGGTVTMLTAPPLGSLLTVGSVVQPTQGQSIPNMGGFYPKVIENALDKLTITVQQIAESAARSFKLAFSDTGSANLPAAAARANKLLSFDANGNPVAVAANPGSATALQLLLGASSGSSIVGHIAAGIGALVRTIQSKLRECVSIDDYPDLQTAFTALAGAEGTGYGALPINLDLLGKEITFAGTIYVPINVSLINGKLTSAAGSLIFRNPFLANTALRGYTLYWPYMKGIHRNVTFNCKTIINVYITGAWQYCDFTNAYSALILVNSNTLWTEYNTFFHCTVSGNAATGAAVIFDGNISNTSAYSTGAGAGTPDGSFGYNDFIACKIDSTAPTVGIKLLDGATWYNGEIGFRGYARGAGPSGAFLNIVAGTNPSKVSHCRFNVHLESFSAASNIISIEDGAKFWYNVGSIQSASPEMTFSQGAAADIRTNKIIVIGAVLQDKTGAVIFQGDQAQSIITNHLLKRLTYVKDDTERMDKLVLGTSLVSPSVVATTALESQVQYTGAIISRPNDTRSAAARNWAWMAQGMGYGDYVLMESTTNQNTPATPRIQIQSGGNLAPAADNTQSFGTAAQRVSVFYAGTGAINTSCRTTKQQIRPVAEAERAVAVRIKGMLCAFKFNDAVAAKGDGARIHFGVIAQDVKAAFEAEGLVAEQYALLCYDEFEDKFVDHPAVTEEVPPVTEEVPPVYVERIDGEKRLITPGYLKIVEPGYTKIISEAWTEQIQTAGNRYGVRYDELLVFLISAL